MNSRRLSLATLSLLMFALATATTALAGDRYKVIASFQGNPAASNPASSFVVDHEGNLYAIGGGGTGVCYNQAGGSQPCGNIFQLAPPTAVGGTWSASNLYSLQGPSTDGEGGNGPLMLDSHGSLYGTTNTGGNGVGGGSLICGSFHLINGCGTVFVLSPPSQSGGAWTETLLYNFQGNGDGDSPIGRLATDPAGNFYGVTAFDGSNNAGLVFELSQSGGKWTETVIHSFGQNSGDGLYPDGGLVRDGKGNLYGEASQGGGSCGCGVVYRLSPPSKKGGEWTETILYAFTGGTDGTSPRGDLSLDSAGNLYGVATTGFLNDPGSVYQLSPPTSGQTWTLTTLHTFQSKGDGSIPYDGVILDKKGNLYGVTEFGGDATSTTGCSYEHTGCGTIYQISPGSSGWTEQILHRFHQNDTNGTNPITGLIFGRGGALYGATAPWSPGGGGIFQLILGK